MKRILLMALAVSVSLPFYANVQASGEYSIKPVKEFYVDNGNVEKNVRVLNSNKVVVARNAEFVKDAAAKLNLPEKYVKYALRSSIAPKAVSDPLFSESFENVVSQGSFSNTNFPQGWTTKRTDGILDCGEVYFQGSEDKVAGHGAWIVESYYALEAYDGYALASCYYLSSDEMSAHGISQQDEWLISPSFTVGENNVLQFYCYYTPLYLFNLDGEHVNTNTYEWINQEVSATLKVNISTDNGDSWTELKDLADDYMGVSLYEMILSYGTTDYYPVTIDLSDYAGQSVKVAFQYVGKDGSIIAIDAVNVGVEALEPSYISPIGSLYFMFDEKYSGFSVPVALMPADTELTWYNTSGADCDQFAWYYQDPETPFDYTAQTPDINELTSTDVNLTVAYPSGYFFSPVLDASSENGATGSFDEGAYYKVGGGSTVLGTNVAGASWGTLNVNTQDFYPYSNVGMGTTVDNSFIEAYGYGVDSLIALYEAPSAAYSLSRVTVYGIRRTDFSNDASFEISVIALDENGAPSNTLAIGKCSATQIQYPMASDGQGLEDYFVMPFDLLQRDALGLEVPVTLSVDCPIIVTLKSTNSSASYDFSIFSSVEPNPTNTTYAYIVLKDGSRLGFTGGSYMIALNAVYPGGEGGEAGVDEVGVAASAAKVAVVGGDFVVTAPEAINAVTVYNVAGQAVAASEVAGTTTVSGQSLAKGVYILRFNDGSSVKVVK